MGFFDALNVKKKLETLKELEETPVDLNEQETPQEYSIFERSAIDIPRLVAPEGASKHETYYKIGDEYCRTLFVHSFPPSVSADWLSPIMRFQHTVDVAMYIQPHDQTSFLRDQRHRAAMDEAALERDAESGLIPNSAKRARLRDTLQMIGEIEENNTKAFQVMVVMTIRGRSIKELDRITEHVERSISSMGTRQARYRHTEGFDTTMPLMNNELRDMQCLHTLQTQVLMESFPLTNSDITHEEGVLIGINQTSGSPIILDRFMQPTIPSANTVIFGGTGSGKSWFAKAEMSRWSYLGVPVTVLDPSGEYTRLCEGLGGVNININAESSDRINPLDFSHAVTPTTNALRSKIRYVVELFGVMLHSDKGEGLIFDATTKKYISNALQNVYLAYGYDQADISTQLQATSERMPIMSEVYGMISRIARTNRDQEVQRRLQPLLAGFERYVGDGDLAPLFDHRTTITAKSHFMNFNYHGLQDEYLPMAMHLVLEYLRTTMFTDAQQVSDQNRLLYVDEAHILMGFPETAKFLEFTSRHCRKYGIGLTVMTQNVGVFTDAGSVTNKAGTAILANSTIKILLKQEPNEAEAITEAFHLTQNELGKLLGGSPGEGLVMVGSESAWFSAQGLESPEERPMFTTTMRERSQIEAYDQQQLGSGEYEEFDARVYQSNELPPGAQGQLPPAQTDYVAFDDPDDMPFFDDDDD